MFEIDTGAEGGGSKGPWISFKPKGSAKHGLGYKSWALREKTESGSTIAKFSGVETPGIVLDVYAKGGQLCGSLKLGWSKSDGEVGKAPQRQWNASPLRSEQRPSEEKTAQGGYVWRNALSVRVALGGGKAATWEDEGWGCYKGFSTLIKAINAGFAANEGLCPMIKCTGYVDEGSGTNSTFVPLFEIVKWVARPECLTEDAPAIEAEPAAAAAVLTVQTAATPVAGIADDIAF